MDEPDELSRERAEALARKIALDRLAERDRSRKELSDALARRRVPSDVIESLLDKLVVSGLQDDEKFARAWVESRQRSRGLAKSALVRELRQKGIDDGTIETVLSDWDVDLERQNAHRLVQRRLPSLARLKPEVQRRRLVGFLQRKGYPASVAFDVVKQELAAADDFEADWLE